MIVFYFYSVGVHVLVEDVNEFAPKWKIHTENKEESASDHTLATNVAIEEGQLLEEVTQHIFNCWLYTMFFNILVAFVALQKQASVCNKKVVPSLPNNFSIFSSQCTQKSSLCLLLYWKKFHVPSSFRNFLSKVCLIP